MLTLNKNGVVIQQANDTGKYRGIEGNNWYLNYLSMGNAFFESYYSQKIEVSWQDNQYVDCCNDSSYIKYYIDESTKRGIEWRLLFCETTRKFPQMMQNELLKLDHIGYDYAYSGGSYYSCVNNDIVANRVPELSAFNLNEYGLLNTEKEILEFVQLRESLTCHYPDMFFEFGDFIIYKLSLIKNFDDFILLLQNPMEMLTL